MVEDAGVAVGTGAGAAAGAANIAAYVASSIVPVMLSPRRRWYSAIAAEVPAPKRPSAPPTRPITSLTKTV